MDGRLSIQAVLSTFLLFATTARAYLVIPYNTSHSFGPDGPWQAVSLGLKYPKDISYTTINVYPGNLYETIAALYVPTTQACIGDTSGTCAIGGTIAALSYTNSSAWYTYDDPQTNYYLVYNGSSAYMDVQLPQDISYTGAVVDVCKVAQVTYPNGKTQPVEVGLVGLGGNPLATQYNPPLALWSNGLATSNSFGLHIGSAQHNYPGSLIFGGYDRGRVIGPVLPFDAHSALGLIDITIGVETGGSPFSFDSKANLLKNSASAEITQPIQAFLKPEYPYIYLPQLTIEAIANNLPVHFDSTSGFWLWDTKDANYEKIAKSPAYLGFVFPSLTGNSPNTTIKVPFSLLNLNLESSISGLGKDVPYFPVMRTEVSQATGYPILLGRAFMQSCFYGTNWNYNISWMAQAPGPGASGAGLGYDPVDLQNQAQTLDVQSGDNLFNSSWAGHWTILSNTTEDSNGNSGTGDDDSPLPPGAIAGIVIGTFLVLGAICALIAFFLIRRSRRRRAATTEASASNPPTYEYRTDKPSAMTPQAGAAALQSPYGEVDSPNPSQGGTFMSTGTAHDGTYYKPVPQRDSEWHEADGRGVSELSGEGISELPATRQR